MKHISLLPFLILINCIKINAQTQEFAPDGAKWWFTEYLADGPPIANYTFSVEGDTTIDGTIYKKLFNYRTYEAAGITDTIRELYFHQIDGEVFFYNPVTLSDELYFNFTAEVGDTLTTFAQTTDDDFVFDNHISLVINSVTDTIIASDTIKQFHYDILSDTTLIEFPDVDFTHLFYDIIGPIGYLIPLYYDRSFYDGPSPGPLKCYEDQNLGLVKFIDEDCDYLETGINENILDDFIQIYPNPSSGKIFFQLNSTEHVFAEVYDITGTRINLVLQETTVSLFEADISDLSCGIYFIRCIQNNQTISTQKFIKN